MPEPLPPSYGLRHVALRVRDLKAAEAFYCGQLGFRVEWRPDADNLYLVLRGDSLALHAEGAGFAGGRAEAAGRSIPTIEPARHGSLDHIGLAFAQPSHVDAWVAQLESHGVRVLEAPREHRDGAYSATIADPEGNAIQLICHPPIVEFEAKQAAQAAK